MKTYQQPHKKLTDEEVKEMFYMLEKNHDMMKDCFQVYIECHQQYMQRLAEHFFPERFSICEVTVGDLNDLMEKAYGGFSFASEPTRMTRPEKQDDVATAHD